MKYQQSIASKSIIVQLHTYIVAIIACVLGGCQDSNDQSYLQLNENELCFTEKLISISKNGNKYYIGTESSGNIYVYSPEKNNLIDTLSIDCGRIYKVKEAGNENTFFVGTQNMGLKYAHKERNGNKLVIDTPFKIKGKEDRYSCYDIYFDDDVIYAMTSHGIFRVLLSDTILHDVYADFVNGTPKPLVASNMIKVGGDLFAATAEGLKRITPKDNYSYLTETILHKNVSFVEYHNNYIYALADSLYKISPQSLAIIDTFGLSAPSKIYYYSDSINYFLSDNNIILVHDNILQKHEPSQQKIVKPRRKLYVDGHNIISNSKEYSLLIADNALWQVGHHLPSVFGEVKNDGIKLTCTDGKSVYFLIGKKIYKLETGSVASEYLELKDKGDIRLMECSPDGNFLYYVNDDNEVFRQSLNTSWYQFWQTSPEYIGNTKKEITAMIIHQSVQEGANYGVILGIRDGIICMYNETKKDTIKLKTKPGIDSIPYIRRFASREADYYVPTMNEGLFFGKGKELEILNYTKNLQFIRDVAYSTQDSFPHFLTNKQIFIGNERIEKNINYGSRLLLSGNELYIPGEVGGVRVLDICPGEARLNDTILFSDIVFRPESSLELNGIVYLGGQSGVIALSPQDDNGNYPYRYIKFEDKKVISRQSLTLVACLIAISLAIFVIIWIREKATTFKRRKRKIRKQAEALKGWKDEVDDEDLAQQIHAFVQRAFGKITQNNIENLEYESESITSKTIGFLREKGYKLEDNLSNFKEQKKLKDNILDLIATYKKKANSNKSLIEDIDVNTVDASQLKLVEEKYRELIKTEDIMTSYRLVFEWKDSSVKYTLIEEMRQKEISNKKNVQIISDSIGDILEKRKDSSQTKIEKLNSILTKWQGKFIQEMKDHINKKIGSIQLLSLNDDDTEIANRLLANFEQLKNTVDSLGKNDANELFSLIEKIIVNDGRLLMIEQMIEIRKKLNDYKTEDRKDLLSLIEKFYTPRICYWVDKDVYKQLIDITYNEKESPKRMTGTKDNKIQFSFVLLAVVMAKKEIPAVDSCTIFLGEKSDKKTSDRVNNIVTKWINSSYVKELSANIQNENNPLYSSVTAFYLNKAGLAINANN